MILVFNKIDAFTYTPKDPDDLTPATRENISLDEFKKTWMGKMGDNCVFISAKEKVNIDELKKLLYDKALEIHTLRFPYNDVLYQNTKEAEEYGEIRTPTHQPGYKKSVTRVRSSRRNNYGELHQFIRYISPWHTPSS